MLLEEKGLAALAAPPKSKIILALDQAPSATGWALFKDGELQDFGVYRAKGYEEQKADEVRHWLDRKISEIALDENSELHVVMEDIQLQRNDVRTFKILARFQGVLLNLCYQKIKSIGLDTFRVKFYYSSEWKSSCKIKGRDRATQKKNAQLLVQERFDLRPPQDACDAICLGLHEIYLEDNEINFE